MFHEAFNSFLWVLSNFLVLYIGLMLVVFLTLYYALFDPRATTAGRFLYRFALSLLGVIALVFISLYLDPAPGRGVMEYPGDVFWWRPALRFVAYLGVAYTVTALNVLLVIRKYFPHMLRTAQDRELVKPRKENK